MDRQTLRDAVVRYNAKGLEGLHDRPKGYSPRRLTADEEAALAAVIIAGDVVGDGEGALVVPTGAVAHHDGVRILVQGIGEVCEKQVHDLGVERFGITRVTSSPVSGRTAEKM